MPTMDDMLGKIYASAPALRGQPYSVIDSRGKKAKYGGKLEFYPPDESENPLPGRATVEVFDQNLQGPMMQKMVYGDMLHYLPSVDPNFSAMRDQFAGSITPEQAAIDQNAYQRDKADYGESRSMKDWFKQSRLDAYLRGHLTPDEEDNWKGAYTPQQRAILQSMQTYLATPRGGM